MADLVTCPNDLSIEDVIGRVVYQDLTGDRYINVFDSGVDIDELFPLDCDDPNDLHSVLLLLFAEDGSGNDGLRGVKQT